MFKNPFDYRNRLSRGCPCGQHESPSAHDAALRVQSAELAKNTEAIYENRVAETVMRQIFPVDAHRRAFLQKLGASTAAAAISSFFPLATATEVFAQAGAIEKKDLKVGFIPITCATPIMPGWAA